MKPEFDESELQVLADELSPRGATRTFGLFVGGNDSLQFLSINFAHPAFPNGLEDFVVVEFVAG